MAAGLKGRPPGPMRAGRGPTPQAEAKLVAWFSAGGMPATAVTHSATGYVEAAGGAIGSLSGTSARIFVAHTSSGALVGQGSVVAGSSTHTAAAVGGTTHDATGYVEAPNGAIGSLSGSSTRAAPVVHSSSGALAGSGSTVAGTSTRTAAGTATTHDATGYVEAQGGALGSLSGTSTHTVGGVGHVSSGALVGQGSIVSGTSTRVGIPHVSSGALVGAGSVVNGTSTKVAGHTSSGALVGPGSAVSGTSIRTTAHTSSGGLVGPGAVVSGNSTRSGSPELFPTKPSAIGRTKLRNRW